MSKHDETVIRIIDAAMRQPVHVINAPDDLMEAIKAELKLRSIDDQRVTFGFKMPQSELPDPDAGYAAMTALSALANYRPTDLNFHTYRAREAMQQALKKDEPSAELAAKYREERARKKQENWRKRHETK